MTASLRASLERLRQCLADYHSNDDIIPADTREEYMDNVRASDLRAALEAIEQDGWVSVNTMMPEVGQEVLFFDRDGMAIGFRDGKGYWCEGRKYIDQDWVTHWRPLPTPPSQEDGPQ